VEPKAVTTTFDNSIASCNSIISKQEVFQFLKRESGCKIIPKLQLLE